MNILLRFFILLVALTSTVAFAKAYKCEVNGKTTYQQSPCPEDGQEFKTVDDLSVADYKAAQSRIEVHHKTMAAQEKADYEAWDRRRQEDLDYYNLRANQSAAIAEHRQANEMRWKRQAIDEQNRLLREKE